MRAEPHWSSTNEGGGFMFIVLIWLLQERPPPDQVDHGEHQVVLRPHGLGLYRTLATHHLPQNIHQGRNEKLSIRNKLFVLCHLDQVCWRDHDNLWNTSGRLGGIDHGSHWRSKIVRNNNVSFWVVIFLHIELCFLRNQKASKSGRIFSKLLQQSTLLHHKPQMWLMSVSNLLKSML